MRFEKLSENKIRITLTVNDLKEKDIDFHDFMSNPLETQDLFIDILREANEQIGFNTTNYNVKIEALAMIDGDFVVNITRSPEVEKMHYVCTPKRKFKVHKKATNLDLAQAVYKFVNFDDYYYFIQYLYQNGLSKSYLIAKKIIVYSYQNCYFLLLSDINSEYKNILRFSSSVTEFGTYITNSTLLISKLQECGNIVLKHNALKTSLKYFETKKQPI